MKYKNIVWDWNGTLLNDLETGVNTLNDMLRRRGRRLLAVDEYKRMFGFPVIDFYLRIGFDLTEESMHEISVDFVDTYERYAQNLQLNVGVKDVLERISKSGRRQYILSALREDLLCRMAADFGIDHYFEQMCGSDNIYAAGKVDRGKRMLESNDVLQKGTLMVGDTEHDAEVAGALGFDCILYAGGHNDLERLQLKAPVITDFSALPDLL